jgi:hypothetical protein
MAAKPKETVPDDQHKAFDEEELREDGSRPGSILDFFKRVGLIKGAQYQTVVMTSAAGRSYIGPVEIADIAAIAEAGQSVPVEIVITFTEPGMKARHFVRFSQLVSWSDARNP